MMSPKPTMMSAHQEQREKQQAGLTDMSKLLRGPVSLLLLPPPHLQGKFCEATAQKARGPLHNCLSLALVGRPTYAEAACDIGQGAVQQDMRQFSHP